MKTIRVDVDNLHFKLDTINPMQLCALPVSFTNIPDSVTGVHIVIFTKTGEHFTPCPLSQDENGDWTVELEGVFFPAEGECKYELFGETPLGNRMPLGRGDCKVAKFDSGQTPVPTGESIFITEIMGTDGTMHKITAVNVGTEDDPDWTTQVEL